MGVQKAIKNLIPTSWNVALREHRVLDRFSRYIYLKYIPREWRNKQRSKDAINRIKHLFENRSFLMLFDPTDPSYKIWSKVYDSIIKYEERWK